MIFMTSKRKKNNDNATLRYVMKILAIIYAIILHEHNINHSFTSTLHCNSERLRDTCTPATTISTDGAVYHKTMIEGAESRNINNKKYSAQISGHHALLNTVIQRHFFTNHAILISWGQFVL